LRIEGERNGVAPNQNWQTPYLQYLLRGELPLDKAEAQRLARRAKSFVLLGDEKELYHRSSSGILQRCISVAQGQELLQEIHSGACGHHAAPRTLVGNTFRQGFYNTSKSHFENYVKFSKDFELEYFFISSFKTFEVTSPNLNVS
jgi:hypothetical protein